MMICRSSLGRLAVAGCTLLVLVLLPRDCPAAEAPRPNILIILLDDMGWSDLGCYGGEVHTPNIDWLAAHGLRFRAFYNAGRCCPTRAALLTGLYPHQAGVGQMTFDKHLPGYRGQLGPNTVTIAEVLREAGYRTAMVGKWHVSLTRETPDHMRYLNNQLIRSTFADPATYPVGRGFEEHYGVIWGVVNYFDPFSLVHNTTAVRQVPDDYYITDAFTDHAIEYIRKYAQGDEPFFLYLAHCAPHWPLHALPEDIEKYKDTYRDGWQAIRQARYHRQLEMGLLPENAAPLSERFDPEASWADHPDWQWDARAMACHAAMIDRVDQGIGRIIDCLRELGELDDTLILLLSDNGASREVPTRPGFDRVSQTRDGRPVVYFGGGKPKKVMPGPETTYASIGPHWANVANTPFRFFKATQHEGGIRTPLVVHWPAGLRTGPGSCTDQIGHVIDLMPTCVELAGARYPKQYQGREITPVAGKSLVPIFRGQQRQGHAALFFEHFGERAVRKGQWKLVAHRGRPWELYNLARDQTETHDLANQFPERVRELASLWQAWAKDHQVLPAPGGAKWAQKRAASGTRKKDAKRPAAGKQQTVVAQAPKPEPVARRLKTRWTDGVTAENVHREYPRPQLVRSRWTCLNGLWDYAVTAKDAARPDEFDGKILVPFPVESQLSGVGRTVGPERQLWYRRTFQAERPADGGRLLLHFGAVDWHATVWVNGQKVGEHKGGYDPFTLDVTDTLKPGGRQELVVSVWDPTDSWTQPRGKQVREPGGIWYTSVTGIWQTVWLEPVPAARIEQLKITPDVDQSRVTLQVRLATGDRGGHLVATVSAEGRTLQQAAVAVQTSGAAGPAQVEMTLPLPHARLWSPDDPFLYDLELQLQQDGRTKDHVKSYFGMRKISIGKDEQGHMRLLLNNRPLFHFGPLDQGWWPDGLYTAPTDEALRYDIEVLKKLGMNAIRKHVKVEPDRWYWWCDKLGMLVWQDMPNGNLRRDQPNNLRVGPADAEDAKRPADSARQFEQELKALIETHYNHPCIVMWVPFNEGWGQYDTARIARWVKQLDPTRLVNAASGWADRGVGDVLDIHSYPGPAFRPADGTRAPVLGEFGGLGWPVEGHLWWNKRNWGYRTYTSRQELNRNYQQLLESLYGLVGRGLAAAIYTQTTDVEGEINGLMTYDRQLVKIDIEPARRLARRLYGPPPHVIELLPTSRHSPQQWRLSHTTPPAQWTAVDFDDSAWPLVSGPLKAGNNPFLPDGTVWGGNEIWLRRTFRSPLEAHQLWLQLYHDVSQLEVYINGKRVARLDAPRPTRRHYRHVRIEADEPLVHQGTNVVAIHARKDRGFRAVDLGLFTVQPTASR